MGLSQKDRVAGRLVKITCLFIALYIIGCSISGGIFIKSAAAKEDSKVRAQDITIEGSKEPFMVGEELTYKLTWVGMNVGTVVARIKGIEKVGARDAYVVELRAKTNAFCSMIYPVDDIFISFIDKERFVSLRHIVRRSEGRYRKDAETIFDYTAKKAYFHNRRDGSRKTFDIPGSVQDTLSAAYYFRVMDLAVGQQVSYQVVNNEQIYELFCTIGNKSFMRVGGHTYEAFYVEPYARLQGNRVEKGKASGYFSCDRLRVPLYGIVKAPLFSKVTAILVHKKEGVRND